MKRVTTSCGEYREYLDREPFAERLLKTYIRRFPVAIYVPYHHDVQRWKNIRPLPNEPRSKLRWYRAAHKFQILFSTQESSRFARPPLDLPRRSIGRSSRDKRGCTTTSNLLVRLELRLVHRAIRSKQIDRASPLPSVFLLPPRT